MQTGTYLQLGCNVEELSSEGINLNLEPCVIDWNQPNLSSCVMLQMTRHRLAAYNFICNEAREGDLVPENVIYIEYVFVANISVQKNSR